MKWYTFKEISDALIEEKKLSTQKVNERKKSFVILIENGKSVGIPFSL